MKTDRKKKGAKRPSETARPPAQAVPPPPTPTVKQPALHEPTKR